MNCRTSIKKYCHLAVQHRCHHSGIHPSLSLGMHSMHTSTRQEISWKTHSNNISSSRSFSSPSPPSPSPSPSPSVSSAEVSKFSKMYERWWDPDYNLLITMNPVRVQYILDTVSRTGRRETTTETADHNNGRVNDLEPLRGLKALDVGCGGGLLSESLARLGAEVTAVDPSEELVDMARRHSQQDHKTRDNITYRGGTTVEQLLDEEPNGTLFDIVCLLEVIEHVNDIPSLLQASTKLLNPKGGLLFVSTINRTWKSYALGIAGAEYVMRYLPPGTHDWNKFLSPEEVQQYMNHYDLHPVDVSGMVLASPPPQFQPPSCFGTSRKRTKIDSWQWRIDSNDKDVNWIGAYQYHQQINN